MKSGKIGPKVMKSSGNLLQKLLVLKSSYGLEKNYHLTGCPKIEIPLLYKLKTTFSSLTKHKCYENRRLYRNYCKLP